MSLGKRTSYTLQWFFERPADETAKAIIQDSSLTSPLWICPEPEPGRKHVLIGVDGSEGSMRAVDHVGYILSKQDQHTVTLLHVENGAGLDSDAIFQRSVRILNGHDVGDERIRRDTTWGITVASTITSYAEKSSFAAIAASSFSRLSCSICTLAALSSCTWRDFSSISFCSSATDSLCSSTISFLSSS